MFNSEYKSSWMDEKDESGYNSSTGSSPTPEYQISLDLDFIRSNPPPQIRGLSKLQESYVETRPGNLRYQGSNLPLSTRSSTAEHSSSLEKQAQGAWNSISTQDKLGSKTWNTQPCSISQIEDPKTWFQQDPENMKNSTETWNFSNYENLMKSLNQYSCSTEFLTPELQDILLLAQACDILRESWI